MPHIDNMPSNKSEWFSDSTMLRIRKIERAGGPRKTYAVRTAWQVKFGPKVLFETAIRTEARSLCSIYAAMRQLGGLPV